MARQQRTIAASVELAGTTLFSGREANVRLLPADTDTGYLFVRTDLPDSPVIPASVETVSNGFRWTALIQGDVEARVVEHILSACVGLGVDNLIVELDGDEMPAMDGCALAYTVALQQAGIVEQNAERRVLVLEQTVTEPRGDLTIVAMPAESGLTVSYILDFDEYDRPSEALSLTLSSEAYLQQIASARTFGFEADYEDFKRLSMGGGVTDENAFILCKDGSTLKPLSGSPAELRFPDEAVRHKILDLLGDLAVIGMDLQAKIVAVRSGHRLNAALARSLHRIADEQVGPEEHLDVREIQRILPHRYPFLMIDRILRIDSTNKIVALKNLTFNEPFFQGHYPDFPVMPGVLQLEAMTQTAGVLLLRRLEHAGRVALLISMDDVKLRRPVRPGDQLIIEVEMLRMRTNTALIKGHGTVDGKVACEAHMRFMLVDSDTL
jgi:UDP-3-O-[3-hydroxymyristoyl] N-acetylglucosamine deacetylase / 3-hydroxyacyl-[acyl-carrier-protein] dehydratase